MERDSTYEERHLVRCLECGTVYPSPTDRDEADACPECRNVGWVAVSAVKRAVNETSS